MIVHYLGDGSFRLQSGELSLLVNPANNRWKADIVLRTLTPITLEIPEGEIVFPGEYEAKNIEIRGFAAGNEPSAKYLKTMYLVTWEEMRFAFLGHISAPPTDDVLEEIGEPDILFLPVGDHFLSGEAAVKLMKKLEPRVTIPSFFKSPNEFLKAAGVKAETEEKLVFKKKDLAEMKGRIVVLEAKNS